MTKKLKKNLIFAAIAISVIIVFITGSYGLLFQILAGFSVGLILIGSIIYVEFLTSPSAKIVKLIEEKRYNEAVQLGESIPESEIDFGIKFNLMASYYFAGQKDNARKMFNSLTDVDISSISKKVVEEWKIKLEIE